LLEGLRNGRNPVGIVNVTGKEENEEKEEKEATEKGGNEEKEARGVTFLPLLLLILRSKFVCRKSKRNVKL
jgi:hypothetical protein